MTAKKLLVALALLVSATSATLAQSYRPGPYYGNDFGDRAGNGSAEYQMDMGSGSGH